MSSGAVIVGFVVSFTPHPVALTVTVCLQLAVRPSASVTVHSIPVMPTGYGSVRAFSIAGVTNCPSSSNTAGTPSLRTPTTVPPPWALKVGVPTETVASSEFAGAVATLFAGQEIVGAGVPTTLTVKVQLPPPSADEVIVCVPTAKNEPEAGLFDTAPQSPVTPAAANFTNAPKVAP